MTIFCNVVSMQIVKFAVVDRTESNTEASADSIQYFQEIPHRISISQGKTKHKIVLRCFYFFNIFPLKTLKKLPHKNALT